ncbi:cation diffusion facilitator family transporter [Sulfolobus sp. E5-1-F]|uniref:cation diffusion facilitator family transporter n=1 Tax=Sulfolobaceae TaxID=118883 RepID=UPI001296C96C|nr:MULTISPECIES: cation diffusion facilitator family transporter [unclassified Sulfolobus]QGA53414.1 cation diffusion facilitator family transporter [Sulfolobus sp. E5-1-F]QGA68517.1 cation diffusion facilitator family transporter [Sulfolobus sp. E11-6]
MQRTFILTLFTSLAFIVAYYISFSPLILAEFSHALIDFLTITFSIIALKFIGLNEVSEGRFSYGLHRLEVVVAMINILTIILLSLTVAYTSITSLFKETTNSSLVLIISSALASILTYFASPKEKDNLGKKGLYIHIISDFLGYIVGFVIGVVMLISGIRELDPVGAITIVILNFALSIPLLKESFLVFMEGSPVKIDSIMKELTKISPGIHHLHVWSICDHVKVATLHVKTSPNLTIAEADKIRGSICTLLREKYGISHVTVQFETCDDD